MDQQDAKAMAAITSINAFYAGVVGKCEAEHEATKQASQRQLQACGNQIGALTAGLELYKEFADKVNAFTDSEGLTCEFMTAELSKLVDQLKAKLEGIGKK